MNSFRRLMVALTLATCLLPAVAQGQDYPNRVVRILCGFSVGGSADMLARLLAQRLSELWGQSVIVENKPGAGGTIAADYVAKATPDGYTLLLGDISTNAIAGSLYKALPYDPVRDFVQVSRLITFPVLVVVGAGSNITSIQDLVVQAKARPGRIRYGSAGIGTSPHVFIEMLNQKAGINTEPIQYKGSAPAMLALMSGEVDFSVTSLATAGPLVRSGKLRALAVSSTRPIAGLPNVPPVASAVPGYEALSFHGLHAPANTPAAVVAKINRDVVKVMNMPETKKHLDDVGLDVATTSTEDYTNFIKQQVDQWAGVIKAANIRPE